MIRFRTPSYPMQSSAGLSLLAGGWLGVLVLWPVGLAAQETRQVTLYTPSGSQQRALGTPMVVDVGLPSPVAAPASAVRGSGTGTQVALEVAVSEGAGGQAATSYAGPLTGLGADTSGNVWVGTRAGLSRFDGQQWTTFTEADGLADDYIYSLAVDDQSRVWAGSWKGLTRFDGRRWTRYPVGQTWKIATAPNGDVWCTGGEDYLLGRFDGQAWRTWTAADMGIVDGSERYDWVEITQISVDGSGKLWAYIDFFYNPDPTKGTLRIWGHLLSFDGSQWESYQFDRGVGMIFADSQNRVWVYSPPGLYVKDDSTWKRYAKVKTGDVVRWAVGAMTEDAAGRFWITEGNYFGVLQGTSWTGFLHGEFSAWQIGPVIDSRGDLWILSRHGLYRWALADQPTSIRSSAPSGEPRSFLLEQNYPNPFNQDTHIGFTLKQRSELALQVLNAQGQILATLAQGTLPSGSYETAWDGRDDQGRAVASGLYLYRVIAGDRQATRKMMLVQ